LRHFAIALAAALLPLLSAESARELYRKTEYRAALEALQPAQSQDPAVWHLAGRALFGMGEYQKAQEWFEKAAQAEPRHGEHMHWLGKTLGRRAETASFITAPKYAVECRKAFEKAVEIDPKNTEAWSDLLEYYLSAPGFLGGGVDKAAAAAVRIGQLDLAEGHFAQAKLAEKKDDWNAAEQHWRAAAELAPKNAGRWIDLARFLSRRGRLEESDKAFEKAAQAEPGAEPRIWFARAESDIGQKRNLAQARQLLNRYLGAPVTPDDPSKDEARKLLKKIS
jgi:tetratricopeptide (TPR) repeat protein